MAAEKNIPAITIDSEQCLGCGSCVRSCPTHVLRLEDGRPTPARPERCIDCRHCTAACPVRAITFTTVGQDYPAASQDPLLKLVQSRRSVRSYQDRLPDRALLQWALDGAAWAPSGKNIHENAWSVLYGRPAVQKAYELVLDWVRETGIYPELLRNDARGLDLVTCGAPCVILGHSHPKTLNPVVDTAIAMQTVELLLVERGLSTCWGGYLRHAVNDYPPLKAYCGIPDERECYGLMMVGYGAEKYRNVPYRPAAAAAWIE